MDKKQTSEMEKDIDSMKGKAEDKQGMSRKKKSQTEKGRKGEFQSSQVSAEHDKTHPYHHGAKTLIQTNPL